MAKIFQLELFIKEMSIWKLPPKSEECDETCVEVNVFDVKKVPICGYVFGKNSTMNRGQNFLFTLDTMPTNENKVFLNVFKKAFNREKNYLGSAKIPIENIFGDILSHTFYDANNLVQKTNINAPINSTNVNPLDNGQTDSNNLEQSATVNTKNAGQSKAPVDNPNLTPNNTTNTTNAMVAPGTSVDKNKAPIISSNPLGNNQTNSNNLVQNATDNTKSADQNQAPVDNTIANDTLGKKPSNPDFTENANVVGNSNANNTLSTKTANSNVAQNANENVTADSPRRSPISRITKDVYPIVGADSKQWGTICILMRLTSFGDFSAHPIHIHQSHNEIILQNSPNTAMYKCVQLDDLKRSKRDERSNQHQPMNYSTDLAELNSKNYDSSDSDLCPCPPTSPNAYETQYEEFKAEIDDNVLCIRVPKNAGIVRRVYDSNESPKRKIYLENRGNPDDQHIKNIPIIRGNRKYPAHYGVISAFPSKCNENNLIYDQREKAKDVSLECTENRILQEDNISCPSDVHIIRKNDDPKRDVFVLRIGKEEGSRNGIQLEMRTPKNPYAHRSTNQQTTSVQTYDDEFVSQINNGGKKGGKKSGSKNGKKGKSKK